MTAAQAREKLLRGITAATDHVEPFKFGGVTYGARVPNSMQMQIASDVAKVAGFAGFRASLCVQCVVLDGHQVFRDVDCGRLAADQVHGIARAFFDAVQPFILAPPEIPALDRATAAKARP